MKIQLDTKFMAQRTKFTVKEELLYGWNTFKKNWQFLVMAFIIVAVAGMVPQWMHDWSVDNLPAISFAFTITGWLVQMITSIGVLVISLKIVDGKKPELQDIYQHYAMLLNYFLGSLIYVAVVILGLILLIVPGIIWGIKYQYTTYLIVDKKMGPLEAFKKSGEITQGFKWKLFQLGIVFILISIIGMIPFGLGLIVTWPVIMLTGVHVYRKLLA